MGTVRIKVKITNAIDEGMARRGQLEAIKVRNCEVQALVDTGAVICVLPSFLVDTLGLARPYHQVARYADGRDEEVDITEPVLLEILGRRAYEECAVIGEEMLIGQTALEKMDLFVDCREGTLVPNPAHPYQSVIMIR